MSTGVRNSVMGEFEDESIEIEEGMTFPFESNCLAPKRMCWLGSPAYINVSFRRESENTDPLFLAISNLALTGIYCQVRKKKSENENEKIIDRATEDGIPR